MRSNRVHLSDPIPTSIQVGNADVPFSSSCRNLGFTVTDNMSLDKHVTNICKSAYIELRRISSIRHYLTSQAAQTLVCAYVLSKLDYCSALLSGCPEYILDKFQKVQNSAARLIFKARKRDHVVPLLKSLHWLPVRSRIDYKLSVLCHNYFSDSCPSYFSELLTTYTPSRQLRSSTDSRILKIPHIKTKSFGQRSFSYAGPKQWNSLPFSLRHIESTSSFKSALKTYLFKKAYSD